MPSSSVAATPGSPALRDVTNTVTPIILPTQSLQSIPIFLQPIDMSQLIPPEQVLEKYPGLLRKDRLTRLAVRLAQESYFDIEI